MSAAANVDCGVWNVKVGERADGIMNPIRSIMDTIAGKENPNKSVLSLAQGDPTAYPHLRPSDVMREAVASAVTSGAADGYQPSAGHPKCRAAIAEAFSVPNRPALTPNDVFMAFGCSEALSHCIAALGAAGSNMLLPRPGFPLYAVLCGYHGVEIRYYDLSPEKGWEMDVEQLRSLTDDKTCGLLINSPANPCGAVYSQAHLTDVLAFAEERHLPIIADEVYAEMTFGKQYIATAAVSAAVPVLSVCALSKRWLAPGWRVGWVMVHDAQGVFKAAGVADTILKLCQVSLGPCAPVQAAVPAILERTPPEWYQGILKSLKESADCCVGRVNMVKGLSVASKPEGAMYFMCRIQPNFFRDIDDDDVAFARLLLEEESVVVLPGQCFEVRGYFRVVFAAPVATLNSAWDRIEEFCVRRML